MSAEPSLRQLQERLFALITAPEGVAKGLRALGLDERDLAAVVRGDGRRSAVERLDVYANMYFFRIRDVLRADFPTLAAVLGDDGFHDLTTDYLLAWPSTHPSLRQMGARLPGFVDGRDLDRPWLAELARLEWARLDIHDALDVTPLTIDDLRARDPESFAALPLGLVPAHALVPARFAVEVVWQSVAGGAIPDGDPAPEPRTLVVWRRGVEVFHRAVVGLEAELLALVEPGCRFGAVCDRVCERVPPDDAPRVAFELLLRWISDALVILL